MVDIYSAGYLCSRAIASLGGNVPSNCLTELLIVSAFLSLMDLLCNASTTTSTTFGILDGSQMTAFLESIRWPKYI